MSSFVGHSVAAVTVYAISNPWKDIRRFRGANFVWLSWLVIVACFPDIDYGIKALRQYVDGETVRITHSFSGALLLPVLTVMVLWVFRPLTGRPAQGPWSNKIAQLAGAGLSHLVLDLGTGVSSLPLLYPFSGRLFKLPFGLLPSAGRLQFDNYFLYRNLFIELGVLVPLTISLILLLKHRLSLPKVLFLSLSVGITMGFMAWAFSLGR